MPIMSQRVLRLVRKEDVHRCLQRHGSYATAVLRAD